MKSLNVSEYSEEYIIGQVCEALSQGLPAILPTETVYGLYADALNPEAVANIYKMKERDGLKALPVQIADIERLKEVFNSPNESIYALSKRFWPGPMTIIYWKNKSIPDIVTGGRDTVGARMPKHQLTLKIIKKFNRPLIATSANISGESDTITASDAVLQFEAFDGIAVDAGVCDLGVASTVVDMTGIEPRILREGVITLQDIQIALRDLN